jgi:hypothetical protein
MDPLLPSLDEMRWSLHEFLMSSRLLFSAVPLHQMSTLSIRDGDVCQY